MQIKELILGSTWLHGGTGDNGVSRLSRIEGIVSLGEIRGRPMGIATGDGAVAPPLQYEGARDIHISLILVGTEQQQWETYRAIAAEMVRAKDDAEGVNLVWVADYAGAPEMRHEIRPINISDDLHPVGPNMVEVQLDMEALDPRAYSRFEQSAFHASSVTCTNDGNANAWPEFVIRGAAKNPVITHVESGLQLVVFNDYTLADSELLTIRTAPGRRGVYEGASNVNRSGYLDIENSYFMPMRPGENTFTLASDTTGANTRLTVKWRHTYTG